MAKVVIGIDECGIGSLAGSVVAAGVVLPVVGRSIESEETPIPGLRDSKKLAETVRNQMAERIRNEALYWVILRSGAKKVDRYGIGTCRFTCMKWCAIFCKHFFPEGHIIVDGNIPIPGISHQRCIVKADDKIPAVQAASIIAKVHRDELMIKLGEKYPRFDFGTHKGYPTPEHLRALKKYGPCPQHRRSYKPVRRALKHVCDQNDKGAVQRAY